MSIQKKTLMIITGASKGLGLALAHIALQKGIHLVTIARTVQHDLSHAANSGIPIEQLIADLSDENAYHTLIPKLIEVLSADYDEYILINNAGTVEPIGLFNAPMDHAQIGLAMQLNVVGPMRLTQTFISTLKHRSATKKIVNISSGAGRGAVAGWGVYCATKAALDRFSEVIALEEKDLLISSLAPGVIDTQMQSTIRSKDESEFPSLNRFTDLYETGSLASPEETAAKIMKFIESDHFGEVVIDDIRNHAV